MKLFKTLFILIYCISWTSNSYAQKNTIGLVDSKSFYVSENGISQLVDALKLANPKFHSLTAQEKDKEFRNIAKKCRDAKDEPTKSTKLALDVKEENVCFAIKNISEFAEKFKKKKEFIILADISSCSYVTHLCETAIDVTQQFIREYNGTKNIELLKQDK